MIICLALLKAALFYLTIRLFTLFVGYLYDSPSDPQISSANHRLIYPVLILGCFWLGDCDISKSGFLSLDIFGEFCFREFLHLLRENQTVKYHRLTSSVAYVETSSA